MTIHRLLFHPADTNVQDIDFARIKSVFTDIGLIGEAINGYATTRFLLGENFYHWITFMGCAPALKLEPDETTDEKFCHIRFTTHEAIEFQALRPEVKGRCPSCTRPGVTAAEFIQGHCLQQPIWSCPHCQHTCSPLNLKWKHEAGAGRCFIELMDVHPHEAVPVDSLLTRLAQTTGIEWHYFYA